MAEEKIEKAGTIALIFSFLMPIVGIICYFANKKEVVNASSYLYAAIGGFIIGIILRVAAVA